MQNILITPRINEPGASRVKKLTTLPPGEVQHTPCALLSPSRERTVLCTWRVFESYSPAWAGGCYGPELNMPMWALWYNASAITARRELAVPALPPQGHIHTQKPAAVPDDSNTEQSTTDLRGCRKHNGIPLQPVILFMPFLHEILLKNPTTIITNKATNMKTNKR